MKFNKVILTIFLYLYLNVINGTFEDVDRSTSIINVV